MWRTHSCVPRRHSCRRFVGQASACHSSVHKNLWPQFALLSPTCNFPPPEWFRLHATFELGKELRSSQTFESTSPAGKRCFLGGTETSGGLTALRNPPG